MNMTSHAESHLHLVGQEEAQIASLLDRVRLQGAGGEGLSTIEAEVPVELIYREDVPVDQGHVEELKEAILEEAEARGDTGQLSRVLLAEVTGHDKFFIVDGFHRDSALSQLGRKTLLATIRPNTTMEELLDIRLLTANTHKAVAFARIVDWIGDAWSKTSWADKISASQAFGLNPDAATGTKLGLEPDETAAIKEWIRDKATRWHMAPSSIRLNLLTAENADPELVKEARRRPSGDKLEGLTPNHLRIIADILPGEHEMQQVVADIVKTHNFSIPYARAVAREIARADSTEVALEIARLKDWKALEPAYGSTKTRALKREEETAPNRSDDSELSLRGKRGLLLTHLELGVASLQNLILRGNYTVPDELERQRLQHVRVLYDDDGDVLRILKTRENQQLEEEFDARMQLIQGQLVQKVSKDVGWTSGDAKVLTYHVADRISQDIESGALRFIDSVHPSVFDRLAFNAITYELRKKRDVHEIPTIKRGKPASPQVVVPVSDVTETISGMRAIDQKQLALGGFMQLSHSTVAQVLHLDIGLEASISQAHKRRFARTVVSQPEENLAT